MYRSIIAWAKCIAAHPTKNVGDGPWPEAPAMTASKTYRNSTMPQIYRHTKHTNTQDVEIEIVKYNSIAV